jgi:hypothetical protein
MTPYPNIWRLRDLFEHCARGESMSSNDGKHYVPARPLGFASIGQRIKAAKLVFSGKADAVIWEQGQ